MYVCVHERRSVGACAANENRTRVELIVCAFGDVCATESRGVCICE